MLKWLKNLDDEDKKVVYIYGTLGTIFVICIVVISMFELGIFKKIDIPPNFVVYMWLGFGVLIISALAVAFRWAIKSNQFDEDTKYQMFSEEDDDRFLRAHFEHEAKKEAEADKKKKEAQENNNKPDKQ